MSCCGNFENSPPTPSMSSNIPVDSHESGESQPGPSKQSGSSSDRSKVPSIKMFLSTESSASPPKAKRSKLQTNPIHDEFTFEDGFSMCSHCSTKLKGKNSTTLTTHVKAKHPKVFDEYQKKKDKAVKDVETRRNSEVVIKESNTSAQLIPTSVFGTPAVSSMFSKNGVQKYSYQDPRQKKITRNIALLISTTTVPVSLVNAPSFKKLLTDINPHVRVPDRKMMRKEVNQVWSDLREALKNVLKVARRVSLTTDIWTSKNMVASYIGITVHFFNTKSRCRAAHKIACREFPNPHTGEMIANKIIEICREFDIDHKLDYISCDNGSNMVASFKFFDDESEDEDDVDAFDIVEEEDTDNREEVIDLDSADVNDNLVSREHIEMDTQNLPDIDNDGVADFELRYEAQVTAEERDVDEEVNDHVDRDNQIDTVLRRTKIKRGRCYAHTGQLAINNTNKLRNQVFGRVLAKGKSFVKKYRCSAKAKYILRQTSYKKRLAGFVKTRWHSDLKMSSSLVEAGECADKPLAKLTESMNWDIEMTVNDIRMLKTYSTLMEPFANKTNLLGGEKYSTIHLVLPTLLELLNHLEDIGRRSGGGVLRFCQKLKTEMNYYYRYVLEPENDDFDPIYHLAMFLDPLFSQILNSDQIKIASDALKQRIKEEMVRKGIELETVFEKIGDGDTEPFKKTQFRGFKHISNLIANVQSNDKAKSTSFGRDLDLFKAEIQRVLLLRTLDRDDEEQETENEEDEECPIEDPLGYWVQNESKYETLLPLVAQDILCIPATSTPSERLFSASGLLASGVMSNISPGNLEKRVLIKVNIDASEI